MRHLFGKEHKEQKSMKLVKKLQLEEDKIWQEELQRRLEQEEKDAAFARELQEQIGSDNPGSTSPTATAATTTTNTINTTALSPTATIPLASTPSPITSSPPPLPAKPTAYHSAPSSSNNGRNSTGQQIIHLQATPAMSNSALPLSSSSPMLQRDVPPPPYRNGQPQLPPRERTISQVSQQYGSSSSFSLNNTTSAPTPPQPSTSQHHSAYLPSLNTAVTPGIGHQTLNPQPYYPSTPQQQHQPSLYPPGTPQTQPQQPSFQTPRRDPAMLIIPPRKEKQPAASQSNTNYTSTSMPMPEPVRTTTSFQYSTPAPSYSSAMNLTSMPTTSQAASAPAAAIITPKPAPLMNRPSHTPAPTSSPRPPMTLSSSYHSLPVSNGTLDGIATHIEPHMYSSSSSSNGPQPPGAPTPSHRLQPSGAKPDTQSPREKGKGAMTALNNTSTYQPPAGKELYSKQSDDDDDDEPLFWERNDGRMMASTPSIPPATSTSKQLKDDTQQDEKHITDTHQDDDYDSGSGSDGEDDDDDDQAIDLFNIRASDNVIIHQHNTSNTKTVSQNMVDVDNDPFADSFAVNKDSNKSEFVSHERSQSTGVIEISKPSTPFQMNNHSSTIAKVHDPLLMMAASKAPTTSVPARPTSAVPWSSTNFAASSATLSSTPAQQQQHYPPIGSTIPRPASVYQHPLHQPKADDDDDLITLDSDDIQPVVPTNVVRAGAPPNIQSMINQVTAEVPRNEFGYYQYQIDKPGGEKEEIDDAVVKALPKLPKTHPDHRHITVPSVIEDQRVWIRVHPTDTGKALASRIHIVATYKTRKILSITTDKGRSIALDDTPVFQDWAGVMEMEDGTPWKVEWTVMDHNLWEGPKEFLRYLKASLRS